MTTYRLYDDHHDEILGLPELRTALLLWAEGWEDSPEKIASIEIAMNNGLGGALGERAALDLVEQINAVSGAGLVLARAEGGRAVSREFSPAAQQAIDETGLTEADIQADVETLRDGTHTERGLLAVCLDGADADREQGWREYVATCAWLAASTWDFGGFWGVVLGDRTAAQVVDEFALEADEVGLIEWVETAARESWREGAGSHGGEMPTEWGALCRRAAAELLEATRELLAEGGAL